MDAAAPRWAARNTAGRIAPGQSARVSIAMYPGKTFKASVESVDWGVSTGQGIPSGELPIVESVNTWVKIAQRFPVRLKLDKQHENYSTVIKVCKNYYEQVRKTKNF